MVGHFNGWDGRRHILRRWSDSGIWELFVPHVRPGDLYKFEIQGPGGKLLALKSDPYAFRCEGPPSTSSIVHGLQPFHWNDEEWVRDRWMHQGTRSPISIYEMHL